MFDAEIIQNLITSATDFTADLLRQLPLTESSSEFVDGYQCGYHYGLENANEGTYSEVVKNGVAYCTGQ